MTKANPSLTLSCAIKHIVIIMLCAVSLIGCGGSSGTTNLETSTTPSAGNTNPSDTNSGDNSGSTPDEGDNSNRPPSQPAMKPSTTIKLGRNLKVLVLSSHTSDRRALQRQEIESSFDDVKEILAYNQISNTYQLSHAQYTTSMSSRDMMQYYSLNAMRSLYPEAYALANSNWIQQKENLALLNDADIIVLRTSFNSENTSGAFWGAAAGEAIIWPNLAKISGLNQNKIFLNSPVDPESTAFPYQHNDYLAQELKITRFDRIFAHEFIHALGYGAHDNGVDLYQTEDFSARVKNDLAFGQSLGNELSYGDCFSVMGNSSCSLMLSPSAKEFLGADLDAKSVYKTGKVTLAKHQLLKIFIGETLQAGGHETVLSYITLEPPKTIKYGQSLTGEIELEDATHSLRPNLTGYLVRLVRVNISIEGTPNVILLDAEPPLSNASYTLKAGTSMDIGGKVRISYILNGEAAEFDVKYL